jgi:hypothetical protein
MLDFNHTNPNSIRNAETLEKPKKNEPDGITFLYEHAVKLQFPTFSQSVWSIKATGITY